VLDENKWRAMRHGHDATLIAKDGQSTVALADLVHREADRLDVPALADLADAESGADRQRRMRAEKGADALCESLLLQHVA
jgi:carboxylate-amine ligase